MVKKLPYLAFGFCTVLAIYFFAKDMFSNLPFLLYICIALVFFASFLSIHSLKKHFKDKEFQIDLAIAGGLTLSTLVLYLYRIGEITPGMWGDEVSLGWMVEQLKTLGHFTPFLPYNLGHPTPLVYLSLIDISLLGRSMLSIRLVSLLFGALSAGLFYFLLRQFFDRLLSSVGSVLLASSYVFIIVSRFGYEMSAAVFFLIASLMTLIALGKKVKAEHAISLGLVLGLGLYSYLAFRTILPLFLVSGLILIWRQKKNRLQLTTLLIAAFLIVTFPLLTYSARHPADVNQRVDSLSVFGQNLPTSEVFKELQGATTRTLGGFINIGDPNPRQNPGNTTPFDLITSILFVIGLGLIIRKNKPLGIFLILICISILATEIVTLERIPDFHYYGLGHPNTLRISPLVPIIIFALVWAVDALSKKIPDTNWRVTTICSVALLIAGINLYHYFGQQPNAWIYSTNFVVPMKITEMLNNQKPPVVAVSKAIYSTQHFQYFLDPSIKVTKVESVDCSFKNLPKMPTILAAADLATCQMPQIQTLAQNPAYQIQPMINPWKALDAILIQPK